MIRLRLARTFHPRYVRHALQEGETLSHRTRLHWVVLLPPLPLWAAVPVVAGFDTHPDNPVATIGVGFAALVLTFHQLLDWATAEVGITDRRLLAQVRGNRSAVTYLHGGIKNVDVAQSRLGRALGFGTVTVNAEAHALGPLVFRWVRDPYALRRVLLRQLDAYRAPAPPALRRGRRRRKW